MKDGDIMKKIFAPLNLFKYEKAYYIWVFSVITILVTSLFIPDINSFFRNGQGIVFIIALLVPFLPELLLPFIINKKKQKTQKYVTYKILSVLFSFLLIVILFVVLSQINNFNTLSSTLVQIVLIALCLFFIIYLYAVSMMDSHQDHFKLCDDIPYKEEETENVEELEEQIGKRDSIGDVSL